MLIGNSVDCKTVVLIMDRALNVATTAHPACLAVPYGPTPSACREPAPRDRLGSGMKKALERASRVLVEGCRLLTIAAKSGWI